MGRLVEAFIRRVTRRPPDFIVGGKEDPYLLRWHLLPRNRFFNVYLHNFLRSDDDRALHDHPYRNASVLLRGAYQEITSKGTFVRTPGNVYFRRAETAHRVKLFRRWIANPPHKTSFPVEVPVWTLFVTGPRVREWGFSCPQGWRHWKDFTDARDKGSIGRGCD